VFIFLIIDKCNALELEMCRKLLVPVVLDKKKLYL